MTILMVMNLGFAWGVGDQPIPGPYAVDAQQAFLPGTRAASIFGANTQAAQAFKPGTQNAEAFLPGSARN